MRKQNLLVAEEILNLVGKLNTIPETLIVSNRNLKKILTPLSEVCSLILSTLIELSFKLTPSILTPLSVVFSFILSVVISPELLFKIQINLYNLRTLRTFLQVSHFSLIPSISNDAKQKDWSEIGLFLTSLLRYRGLRVHPLSLVSRIKAVSLMKDYGLNFDDALAVQALQELSTNTIVSYDGDFNSVGWVKRRIPEDILQE